MVGMKTSSKSVCHTERNLISLLGLRRSRRSSSEEGFRSLLSGSRSLWMSSEAVGNADSLALEIANDRKSSRLRSSPSSAMRLASSRQMRQSQGDAVIIGMLRRLRPFAVDDGKRHRPVFSFRTCFGSHAGRGTTPGVFGNRALTVFKLDRFPLHVRSERRTSCSGEILLRSGHNAEDLFSLVGVAASIKKGPRQRPGARSATTLVSNVLGRFGNFLRSR